MVSFRSTVFAIVVGCLLPLGCRKQEQPTANPEPFKQAVAAYLQVSNMSMKLKEIKAGPAVSGNEATLTASLVHAEMGGPAVTWQFTFRKAADGVWKVDSVQR